jgi:hypothetical protein
VNPKDADLLVTVEDEADLAPLARLGRRLQGRAQSMNKGADVFLADAHHHYLGRTCTWKECAPGIRLRFTTSVLPKMYKHNQGLASHSVCCFPNHNKPQP